jgi:hypothetical protein
MDTAHSLRSGSVLDCAVKVKVAVAVPEFVLVAVKVVVPHPLTVGVANDENTNEGSTTRTLSDGAIAALIEKTKVIAVGADVTALSKISVL